MGNNQIIIVEDEVIIAHEIKHHLETFGHTVSAISTSGNDALMQIKLHHPDLVLMDIKLKGEMNGIEVAEKAHMLYDVPIVYLTANADQETVERAKKTEPYGLIYKPVQPEVLRATIDLALYKHEMGKQLKERESRLEATLNSIGEAVIATDTGGLITSMNQIAVRLTGWTFEEAEGKPVIEIFNIVDAGTGEKTADPGKKVSGEGKAVSTTSPTLLIAKDGKEYQIADTEAPIRDSRGDIIGRVLVFRDVTEEYRTQVALETAKNFAENIVDTGNSIIVTIDAIGRIKLFNQYAERLTGYTKDEVLGKNWFDLFVPSRYRVEIKEVIKDVLSGKPVVVQHENPIIIKSGEERLIGWTNNVLKDPSGKIYGALSIGMDITEFRKSMIAVKENDLLMRKIAENYPNSYLSIVEEDLTVSFTSGQGFKKQNLEPEQFIGLTIEQIFADEAGFIVEQLRKTFQGEEQTFEFYFEDRYQIYHSVPLFAEDGSVPRILLVVEDITDRKLAENKLRESEKRYRSFVNHSGEGIFRVDIVPPVSILKSNHEIVEYLNKHAVVAEVNKALAYMYGLEPKDMIGKPAIDFAPDYGVRAAMVLHKKNHQVVEEETLDKDKDGKPIYLVESFHGEIKDKELVRIWGVQRNITEQKEVQEALLINEDRLNLAMSVANDGLWDWDLTTNSTYFDPRYYTLSGYEPNEFPGTFKEWTKRVHPENFEQAEKGLRAYLAGEIPSYDVEFRFLCKDGEWMWIRARGKVVSRDTNGAPLRMVGTHADISKRKAAEQALKNSEERLKILFESAPDAYFLTDLTGTFLDGNRAAEELIGYTREEVVGKNYKRLGMLPARELTKAIRSLGRSIAGKSTGPEDFTLRRKDGELVQVEILTHPVKMADKTVVLGLARDIRERKKAEEQIQKDLKEKEVLLQEIHHRVKNNLNVIMSLLNLQAEKIESKEDALTAFEESRKRIYSMALVHEQLYRSNNFSNVDMNHYINTISHELRQSCTSENDVDLELSVDNIFLDVNYAMPCGLILNELITNAYKHAFLNSTECSIKITFRQLKNRSYKLTVEDNGAGLPEDIDIKKSETLGLQLVKILTEQINGDLEIKRNNGTIFTIRFTADQ